MRPAAAAASGAAARAAASVPARAASSGPERPADFARMRAFYEKRYPLDDPYAVNDPLFREHLVRKFAAEAGRLSEAEKADAKAARTRYRETEAPEPKPDATLEERARAAVQYRTDKRVRERDGMSEQEGQAGPEGRAFLDFAEQWGFGNRQGINFDQLMRQNQARGMSEEESLRAIEGSSRRTNAAVDQSTGAAPARQAPDSPLLKDWKKYGPDLVANGPPESPAAESLIERAT